MTTEAETSASRAWDIYKHGDLIRIYRISYGMVAQAMFMVSFVTLFSTQKNKDLRFAILEIAICLFGIFFSFIQFLLAKSLSVGLRLLRQQFLVDIDPIFTVYESSFRNRLGSIQTTWIPVSLVLVGEPCSLW
jgi:hypothetical protein